METSKYLKGQTGSDPREVPTVDTVNVIEDPHPSMETNRVYQTFILVDSIPTRSPGTITSILSTRKGQYSESNKSPFGWLTSRRLV